LPPLFCYHGYWFYPVTAPKFILRDYDKRDFETLFKLDRLCFDPGMAYSRPELASFIEQRRAYTLVAEWDVADSNSDVSDSNSNDAGSDQAAPKIAALQTAPNHPGTDLSSEHEPAEHEPAIQDSDPSAPDAVSPTPRPPRPPRVPIAGFITFHFQRQGYGHIITLDVHPDARRHSLGTQLINAACERMRKMTAFMVVLEVAVNNHTALAFYEKHGFKRVKVLERYYSRDVDGIFMTKRL
jgi:ribosomal protein S18 acetylase RimI-like enzyme